LTPFVSPLPEPPIKLNALVAATFPETSLVVAVLPVPEVFPATIVSYKAVVPDDASIPPPAPPDATLL
jgi:hypothetical protein